MQEHDYKSGIRITIAGIVVNLLLFGIKLAGGIFGHSHALVADAAHSASDFFTDLLAILGLKYLKKPGDAGHPYGHGKIETLSSMFLGLFLVGTAALIACNALFNIYHHRGLQPGGIAIPLAGISVVLKEFLFQVTIRAGKKIKSSVLIANAWHHRSDAFSSIAVFIAVTACYIRPDWHVLDSYAALLVSFFVAWVGIRVAWKGIRDVVDSAPEAKIQEEIEKTAGNTRGVIKVRQIRSRYSGGRIIVDIVIEVDSKISVRAGHAISTMVEKNVCTKISDVMDVLVHVEPGE